MLQSETTDNPAARRSLLAKAEQGLREILQVFGERPAAHSLAGWVYEARQTSPLRQGRRPNFARNGWPGRWRMYRRAVQLGERRPEVVLRLSSLLNNPVEAAEVLSLIGQETINSSNQLVRRQSDLLLQVNQIAAAQQVAEQATRMRPTDPTSWLTWRRSI